MIDSLRLTITRPDAAEYSVAALHLAQLHSRESFEQTFGVQPPPFDPSKPAKQWAITDCIGDETFSVVKAGSATLAPLKLSPAEAAAVNIPGAYRYDQYWNNPASPAIKRDITGTYQVKGETLVLREDALALAAEITADTGVAAQAKLVIDGMAIWNGEPRRQYTIDVKGVPKDAAMLMSLRYREGVGRPGKWVLVGTVLDFIPSKPAIEPPPGAVEIPVPIAPLLPDEELYLLPFSGVMVRRRSAATVPVSDNAVLAEILTRVKKICEVLGV